MHTGAGCAIEEATASACLEEYLPPASPGCLRFCELDAATCARSDAEWCKGVCRAVALVPECVDEHDAHRACIAAFEAPALVCVADEVEAANSSCSDEATALDTCLTGD